MIKNKNKKHSRIWLTLLWLTNNEPKASNEVQFDVFFFIGMLVVLIAGTIGFTRTEQWYWASIIWIEFFWAWDALRHNRTYIE